MDSVPLRRLAGRRVFLFLLIVIPACAQSMPNEPVIPFMDGLDKHILLTMTVEGKPLDMLLDTGSQRTIFRRHIGSEGDFVALRWATGVLTARECEVVLEKIRIVALCGVDFPTGDDGLLGEDFLRRFSAFTVDYKNHVLRLVP